MIVLILSIALVGILIVSQANKIGRILIKHGERETLLGSGSISDVVKLNKISKKEKDKYKNLINNYIVFILIEFGLIVSLIITI